MKKGLMSAAIVLAAAACQDQADKQQLQRDVWVTSYNVAFDVMVACLASTPQSGFQVYPPGYPEAGMARIVYIPANTPQARSEFIVVQMVGNVSQVRWKRFGNITGGYDWIDNEARKRADACGGM